MSAMLRRPRVILIIDTMGFYGRRILNGLVRYLRSQPSWLICLDQRGELTDAPSAHWIKDWCGEGVICRTITPLFADHLRGTRLPVVNLNDKWDTNLGLPLIRSDDYAIGRLAGEHLLERGFRSFAFCGYAAQDWSRKRREGFAAAVGPHGAFVGAYEVPWDYMHSHRGEPEREAIGRWLKTLPRPLGILACNDMRGQHVLDACQRINAAVPEEVAVLGVDDDELLCRLCHPPLSSVVPNAERIGYEAAELLDRMMAGGKSSPHEVLVEPLGVTTRQSTDVLALDNLNLATALRYIREHACQGVTVQEVLEAVPVSRTLLERQFRKYLGHSPQAEIQAVQLKRVKQLLSETDLSLKQIARLAGYKHPEYMAVVFKRLFGQTPGSYRRLAQVRQK